MNGPSARRDSRWMARATSSLPVPLSPAMNTVVSAAATLSTARSTAAIFCDVPMISSKRRFCSSRR